MNFSYVTVSQLNRYAKSILSEDTKLRGIYIKGEISNFNRNYRSGHCYFSLKDSEATIKSVMFKGIADRIKFDIEDGLSVIVRADVTLYERDGTYQLVVSDMIPYGVGEMTIAYEQLKSKLAENGLFDASNKKPIPRFPKKIAVISSKTGAAIQDILNILGRRMPYVQVHLYPVSVQGVNTAPEVIRALKHIDAIRNVDTVIIARGGGSSEDLFQFNDEALAYAIYNCSIPIISAIGHETDFTICDFVADLRAPTPSAAAELAGVSMVEISEKINATLTRAKNAALNTVLANKYTVNHVHLQRITAKMHENTKKNRQQADFLIKYSEKSIDVKFSSSVAKFEAICTRLEALNPLSVLKRGYAVITDDNKNQLVSKDQFVDGQKINIKLKDGNVEAKVIGVEN